MNFDKIFYFILCIPLIWVIIIDQHNLKIKKVFTKYLLISICVIIIGIVYQYYSENSHKSLAYYGSQMTFVFLILYKLIRIPYYWIYKREPEIETMPSKNADFIPSFIVIMGTILLPILIDVYIIQKMME